MTPALAKVLDEMAYGEEELGGEVPVTTVVSWKNRIEREVAAMEAMIRELEMERRTEASIADSLGLEVKRLREAILLSLPRFKARLRDTGHRPLEFGEPFRECCPDCYSVWELERAARLRAAVGGKP